MHPPKLRIALANLKLICSDTAPHLHDQRRARDNGSGRWSSRRVEWPGGVSPPGSHRSGRERLHSSGSYCPAANGFALAKGSSRIAVDLPIKLDSVAPSLQPHYRAFPTTTRNSAPVPRIGTRVLMVLPLGRLPLHRSDRFPRSTQEPEPRSRRLYAGRHLGSKQGVSQTSPGLTKLTRF